MSRWLLALALTGCTPSAILGCEAQTIEAEPLLPSCHAAAVGVHVTVAVEDLSEMGVWSFTHTHRGEGGYMIVLDPERAGPCLVRHEVRHALLWRETGDPDREHLLPGWGGECQYDEWSRKYER